MGFPFIPTEFRFPTSAQGYSLPLGPQAPEVLPLPRYGAHWVNQLHPWISHMGTAVPGYPIYVMHGPSVALIVPRGQPICARPH